MRGQAKEVKSIKISGNIFFEYRDISAINKAYIGDILLSISLESRFTDPYKVWNKTGSKGFLKGKIFDGKKWCYIKCGEFFDYRENYFRKTDNPLDVFNLCCEIIKQSNITEVFRTYREHYSSTMPSRIGYRGRKDDL